MPSLRTHTLGSLDKYIKSRILTLFKELIQTMGKEMKETERQYMDIMRNISKEKAY